MKAVIDTNVLVSALWTPEGNASLILSEIIKHFPADDMIMSPADFCAQYLSE